MNVMEIIEVNEKLSYYEKKLKNKKNEKKDIENSFDELKNFNINNRSYILSYLMEINCEIKSISHEIYKLYNYRNNIYNNTRHEVHKHKMSKGEKYIQNILDKLLNKDIIIYYEYEHVLPIKYIKHLRCDFYLIDVDMRKYIIEYQGIQHYEYIKHFHKNIKVLEWCGDRDILKEKYCHENNIKYLAISYKTKKQDIYSLIYKFISKN
jgi:hypothetical protein